MTGYGTIYQFEFDGTCNPFGTLLTTKGKVLILKKDYNGSIYTIPNGQVSPVEIDYPTADDDIFYPLKGSSLTFKVLGGVINMDSIISEDEKEYFLEYYRDAVLFWSGFVSPELCEEDIFLKYPAIEFKTIDGLGSLKNQKLKINNKYPAGILSLFEVIFNALKGIGYEYGLNVLAKVWNDNHTKTAYSTPLEQTYVYTSALRDNNFEFKDNVDLVLDICNLFNAFVYQNAGQWFFVKPKDLAFGVNQATKFSNQGVINTSTKATIPTLVHGTNFLIVAEPKRKIRRFYKYMEVEYEYGSNKFINGDFTLWNGTATPITKTAGMSLLAPGYTETLFKGFTKSFLGTPKTYLVYDAVADKYILALTSALATGSVSFVGMSAGWNEGFNLSITSETNNPSFRLSITIPFVNSYQTYYYNFGNDTWQESPYIYTKAVNYPSEDMNIYSKSFPFPPVLDAWSQYNYKSYAVDLVLYAQSSGGGYETWYNQILLNAPKGSTLPDKEITKIDNIKNASIIPPKKVVYAGDAFTLNGVTTLQDYSNLYIYYSGDYFPSTWPVPSVLGPTYPPTGGWYEREEEDKYGVNELTARNILNQYSDYRNIFTGTLIGKGLQYGAIYEFPLQGALNSKKFWPLSIKMNERDNTGEVVLMELSSNEITGQMTISRYDQSGLLIATKVSESKKKSRNGIGTDLGQAGDYGTIFDRFVAFFMDDFNA